MHTSSRRNFVESAAKSAIGGMLALPVIGSLLSFTSKSKVTASPEAFTTGFDQTPLAYTFAALEPNIDAETMQIHYTKHAAGYSKNLKAVAAAEGIDTTKPLEDVLAKVSKYSTKIRNNAGGHYNHELFWKILTPNPTTPSAALLAAINKDFGSIDTFKKQFNDAATTRFGSGWAWLIVTPEKKLIITSTANQDNTMMDISEVKGFPLMGLDVWEHAYYLKYRNLRSDYISNFWKVLNWSYVNERFAQSV